MKVIVFSTKPYDREFLTAAAEATDHEFTFLETRMHGLRDIVCDLFRTLRFAELGQAKDKKTGPASATRARRVC